MTDTMRRQPAWMIRSIVGLLLMLTFGPGPVLGQVAAEDLLHARAVEAVIWGVPLVQFKAMRDALAEAGAGFNAVGYHSRIQNWKMQFATPNDTTPYVLAFWNLAGGPVVFELPASEEGVALFGTLMDAWQRPLEDVGAAGLDGGRGGRYLLLPPGFRGHVPAGYIPLRQKTLNGYTALRPILPDTGEESLARAAEFARRIRIYPLAEAGDPPPTPSVDLYDNELMGVPTFDGSYFTSLHEILQEEVVEEKDLAMLGMLASIGIEKGAPFAPDGPTGAILERAAQDALEHLIRLYHTDLIPPFYDGTRWTIIAPAGVFETGMTYEHPGHLDYQSRGALYYGICTSVKNPGAAVFYLSCAKDPEGNWLDGGRTYKLNVPANVPARDFWSVVAYDLQTAAWIREKSRVGLDSPTEDLQNNDDGTVDEYMRPRAPDGKESNWVPTAPGDRFFVMFRFYGPELPVFTKEWSLGDLEMID